MIIKVNIDGSDYELTDEEEFNDLSEEIVFEIGGKFIIAMFDDMLGAPIDKVWKIVNYRGWKISQI
jgi:hypothetical protein